jgi:uncharacterized protein (DUF2384 family)
MTQMADEIRALTADLYDDPEDFLNRPHWWFGGRSPDELMATEAGQFLLLKFLRGRNHMPLTETDRDFRPYTAPITDPLVVEAIAHLERKIERLRSLQGSGPEIATIIGKATEAFGKAGVLWLVEYNQVLQAVPLDLIVQGETESVLTLIDQIEYGVYV